jgi:hypothetical protein
MDRPGNLAGDIIYVHGRGGLFLQFQINRAMVTVLDIGVYICIFDLVL